MNTHKNAPLTPRGVERRWVRSVVEGGLNKAAAARHFNTTAKDGCQMGQALPPRGRG